MRVFAHIDGSTALAGLLLGALVVLFGFIVYRRSKQGVVPMRLLLRRIAGWGCMFIGVLGIILPVIPGLPFCFVGVAILGKRDPLLRRILLMLKRRVWRWARLPGLRGQIGRWGQQLTLTMRAQLAALEQHRAHRESAKRMTKES